MRIGKWELHPASQIFPLMSPVELELLAADIREHGQKEPVLVLGDQVLDGRNRLLACERAAVEPQVVAWRGAGSPTAEVISRNLHRRHLNESQRALIAMDALPALRTEAKERQRKGKKAEGSATWREGGKASEVAAAAVGVSARTVERASAVAQRAPELVERIRTGDLTLGQAEREVRRKSAVESISKYEPPTGLHSVIVVDPPWKYRDELEGDGARGGLPYPPMALEDICALEIPADRDCVLWLWTTNPMLLDGSALQVLQAWSFTPRALLTWDKERMATGHWLRGVTEHCILATRGEPVITLTNETTLIREARREHSRKPESFWPLVERLCPAKAKLEMFAREPRPGWTTSGAEVGTRLFEGRGRKARR
jgi:N6-adenosine-specific RNA methylase IME4